MNYGNLHRAHLLETVTQQQLLATPDRPHDQERVLVVSGEQRTDHVQASLDIRGEHKGAPKSLLPGL